jgi:uncharacterized phage protein (TIGR01671 family)
MNRPIKFRGLTSSGWVYGYLHEVDGELCIQTGKNESTVIQEETVGQFTGLLDKNGKEIYEGDILIFPPTNGWEKINYSGFEVFFHDGDAHADYNIGYTMCRMHNHGSVCGGLIPSFKPKTTSQMIIEGNIHENPELLTK